MKASIPSRHHPPHAAQKPLIWLEFSFVRVARRGAAVAVAVAGVAAIQVLCCEGGETEASYWGKSQTSNLTHEATIQGNRDSCSIVSPLQLADCLSETPCHLRYRRDCHGDT